MTIQLYAILQLATNRFVAVDGWTTATGTERCASLGPRQHVDFNFASLVMLYSSLADRVEAELYHAVCSVWNLDDTQSASADHDLIDDSDITYSRLTSD